MAGPSRRSVLAAMLALSVAGCTASGGQKPKPSAPAAAPRAEVSARKDGTAGAVTLQVVAHPDDDLYFMNPDVHQSIDANHRVVSVYLTSGEADGRNNVPGQKEKPKPDFGGYAGSRQQGLRQAYSLMATGKPLAEWKRTTLDLPGGWKAETDSLVDHPGVTLVFLGVAQHTADQPGSDVRLQKLWADPKAVGRTRVATGSTVREPSPVTGAGVVDALAAVLERFKPTLVRTMDPDPDAQVHDAANRKHHDQPGFSDHPDHTAAAQFTYAALDRYKGPGRGKHFTVTAYRGYYNERWPFNLTPAAVRDKGDVLNAYGGSPDSGCGFAAGCGDYDVGRDRSYGTGWLQSTTHRYPGTTTWLQQGPDGRLTAFGVLDRQAAMWTETTPGSGRFDGPKLLGGGPLMPHLAVSRTKDGRWQLFGERIAGLGHAPESNRREIVTVQQERSGGAFGTWTSLGTPDADPARDRLTGAPVVARNADDSAQVFARNAAKGVSTRRQAADGSWSEWKELADAAPGGLGREADEPDRAPRRDASGNSGSGGLGGLAEGPRSGPGAKAGSGGGPDEVQEGLSAVTDKDGRIHVVGSGHGTILHWAQEKPGADLTPSYDGRLPTPADPPTLFAQPDGSLLLAYREPKTSKPLAYRLPDAVGNQWQPVHLGLAGRGYGVMALAGDPADPSRAVLVTRNSSGTLSASGIGQGAKQRWSTFGTHVVGPPSVAVDAKKRLVAASLTPEGTLQAGRLEFK
ncbi:PIG-L family deacetylase [Streptomyces cinnamoneus]|nr:PIG-L family deacetylase [Streptomyces cinnamoneus]